MTPPDSRLAEVLRLYAERPMAAGDAVLVLDSSVCMEVAGLADHWDEVLRRNTAGILRETATEVVLAIARPGADLLPEDYRLWRELHQEVGHDVSLAPVQALPAA